MNIEGEWTTGSHRLLRELMKRMKTDEDDRLDLSVDHRGAPHLMVRDMVTGSSIEIKGRYLRRADYTQRIREKRPDYLLEALLMEIINHNLNRITEEERRQFWQDLRGWMRDKIDSNTWSQWVSKHEDRLESISKLLDKHLKYEHKRQSGHTLIEMEDVVQERHAKINPNLVEGWEEPQEEEKWTL